MTYKVDLSGFPELLSGATDADVDPQHVETLDQELHGLWSLGRNLILAWAPAPSAVDVLFVPHYLLSEFAAKTEDNHVIHEALSGLKQVEKDRFHELCMFLGHDCKRIHLPFEPGSDVPFSIIETLIKRYGISYVEDRAVALFDIVGFSLLLTLDQVTQLNSLAYSLNSAHSKMLSKNIEINFARSTTGDGFYIWNRDVSIEANVNLYHFMHLVLADNAIAHSKAAPNTTPDLRACFHVGGHYEFHQSEGLSPTVYSYIVGDVTIELARMIDRAVPGQILVGDFMVPMPDWEQGMMVKIDTLQFIHKAQETLSGLQGLVLSGDTINDIKCYLTGDRNADNSFAVSRFQIADKHERTRNAYNAKVNIYREDSEPIFLGRQTSDLSGFDYVKVSLVSPVAG